MGLGTILNQSQTVLIGDFLQRPHVTWLPSHVYGENSTCPSGDLILQLCWVESHGPGGYVRENWYAILPQDWQYRSNIGNRRCNKLVTGLRVQGRDREVYGGRTA